MKNAVKIISFSLEMQFSETLLSEKHKAMANPSLYTFCGPCPFLHEMSGLGAGSCLLRLVAQERGATLCGRPPRNTLQCDR
jgi:hypothetical protein